MPDPKNRPYIEPTRSDSLDVVRNSQAVNDFYTGQNYSKDGLNTPTHEGIFNSLDEKYKDFVNKYKNGIQTNNTSGGSSIGEAYEPRFYRKNVDGNKFYQRETADNVINFEAPMALYNRNIMPHHLNYYRKNVGMVGDDIVSIPMYDILATTPADMLTDEQLIKRVQEFGPKSIPNSRLRKLGLPLNEDTPSASSLKRKEDRDTFDRQLKEAGLYNRAEGVTGRNPDASRMYEEYMRSKQPSQSNVPQVPNQVQSAGEAIKQPIEERIPEGYQINRGYTREGVTYGDVYNPTTAQGKTYPIPGSPTMEDYERLYGDGKGNVNTPKRTGTRTVRAKFAAGGTPPTDPPYENDSTKVYNQSLLDLANLNNRYPIGDGKERVVDKGGMTEAEVKSHMAELTASSGVNNASYYLLDDSYDAVYNKFPGIEPSGYNVRDVYRKRPGSRALAMWTPTDKPVNRLGNLDDGPPLNNRNYGDVVAGEDGNFEYVKSDAFGNHDIPESYEDWVLRTHISPIYAEPKGTSKTKPRSESSLKREEARNILKKEMDTLGFTGYSAREVSKKDSEAEKAYQKHLGNYTETTAVETPKVVETPTKPEVTKPKVTLPKGYSYTQHESRDEDMNDYFFTNKNGSKKRISREDFIKNTNYSPTQFRERHVEIPEFRDGGPINPVKITLPDGSVKEVARDSDEYKQAYDQGNIMTKFGEDSYVAPELDEFTVTSETDKERRDAYLARAGKHFAEENLLTKYWDTKKKFQDLGKGALETVGKVASIPQAIGVMDFKRQIGQGPENFNEFKDAAWNKQETPSDVIDSFGPNNMTDAARFALDFGMDPMWLMGSGIGKGSGALANLSSKGLKGAKGTLNKVDDIFKGIKNKSTSTPPPIPKWATEGKDAESLNKMYSAFSKNNKSEINKILKDKKDWLNSDEYLARRMDNTGESAKAIKKDVALQLNTLDRTPISFENMKDMLGYAQAENLSAFQKIRGVIPKKKIALNPDYASDIANTLGTISHEVDHVTSPLQLARNYDKGYPHLNLLPSNKNKKSNLLQKLFYKKNDNAFLNYMSEPIEQQARFNRANPKIRKDLGLDSNTKILTEEQLGQWLDGTNSGKFRMGEPYSDVTELLDLGAKAAKNKKTFRRDLLDVLNKAWAVPGAVGAGSLGAASQKAYGGPINNDGPLAKSQGDIYLPLDGTRPSYIDASGKERSEYKIGVGTKEGEMVIPTVWNGEQHTEDEAIDRYYNTGEHMGGPYDSIEEGERAAKLRTFLYNEHPAYRNKAYGGYAPKYAQGGQLYEAEGGEVIDGGNPITLQGGHISPNSSNSGKIVGNSHGNGGVKMTGGEKIYSDRLKVDVSFLKDLNI